MRPPGSTLRLTCIVPAGRDSGRFGGRLAAASLVAIPDLLSQIRDLRGWHDCRDPGSAVADSGSAGLA